MVVGVPGSGDNFGASFAALVAHLVFCAAAIFHFTEALMVRFFFGAAPDIADAPRILRSSLFRASIRSLIAAARLSWLIVRSDKFMGLVNIQYWWKSSTGQRPLPATTSLIFAQVMTLKQPDSLSDPLSIAEFASLPQWPTYSS